jgi:hypothetical protein
MINSDFGTLKSPHLLILYLIKERKKKQLGFPFLKKGLMIPKQETLLNF